MTRPGLARATLVLFAALAAPLISSGAARGGSQEPSEGTPKPHAVPADTLPTPLLREELLGLEGLGAGWTASDDLVALGRRLFFDPVLSADRTIACASCHLPERAFADDRQFSVGINGQLTKTNAPSLLNKALSKQVLWAGGAPSLEEQALKVIADPTEMGLPVDEALARLTGDDDYVAAFEAAVGGPPTAERLASAVASFVRSLTMGDSPVDRFRIGQVTALNAAEKGGLWLYEGRGGCWRCHNGPNFSDEEFHNTGVGAVDGVSEDGLFATTGAEADRGKFRTPGLRGLAQSGPYMHDGSLATLREVVEFYRDGGGANAHLSDEIQKIELTEMEVDNLVAFLEALSRAAEGPVPDQAAFKTR